MKLKILSKKQVQKIKFNNFVSKSKLRKRILKKRENINKRNIKINFNKIIKLLKKKKKGKKIIGGYYPVNYEVDNLSLLKKLEKDNFIISLPSIKRYFETKKKINEKKMELENLSNKFKELKSLIYEYKEKKEKEIEQLAEEHSSFKKEIEKNKEDYEKIVDDAADQIENFVQKINSENLIQ